MRKFVIFDTETGGLDTRTSALVSLGGFVVNVENDIWRIPGSEFYFLVQNENNKIVTKEAVDTHHITPVQQEKEGISLLEAQDVWREATWDTVGYVGHNVGFDISMLLYNNFYIHLDKNTLDTKQVGWDYWPEYIGKKKEMTLTACMKRIEKGFDTNLAHNALEDCYMVEKLLKFFIKEDHLGFPVPLYPVFFSHYQNYAFGYNQILAKGLTG